VTSSLPTTTVRVVTAGLVLREFRTTDHADLLAAFADEDIARWNPGPTGPDAAAQYADARNDWTGGDHLSWAVADASDRLVGSVSLHKVDTEQGDAEVGYWTAPSARRQGYSTRAVATAARWAVGELGLHRIYLYHAVENVGSCHVARSAGFLLEGTLRQSYRYADGRHHDEHLHAMLATDLAVRAADTPD
jgi:RimJ/RimL family protein N-acetyltransferase